MRHRINDYQDCFFARERPFHDRSHSLSILLNQEPVADPKKLSIGE